MELLFSFYHSQPVAEPGGITSIPTPGGGAAAASQPSPALGPTNSIMPSKKTSEIRWLVDT